MPAVSPHDYSWLPETQPDLAEAYCLSYVRGLGKTESLRRLGVDPRDLRSLPLEEAVEACLCAEGPPPLTAHALRLEGWTVLIEPTGCRSTRPEVYRTLSLDTEVVSVRVLMESRYEFRWIVDGELATAFDVRFPEDRCGSRPDALLGAMREVGFFSDGASSPEDDAVPAGGVPDTLALALAERVTGVGMRPHHLDGPLLGAELYETSATVARR